MSPHALRADRRIAVLATLDTKGAEAELVADAIRERGHEALLIDVRTDRSLERQEGMAASAAAAAARLADELAAGALHGVVALGGGTGSWIGAEAMKALPIGFPKLIVTTFVHGDGASGIAILPTVADIAGVNRLLGPILLNAAGAICGMAEQAPRTFGGGRATIGMTMFGVTTAGGDIVRQTLEEAGCEVVVFHATGAGGDAMERLARQGMFDAVIDWTTSEITDHLVGGICAASPERMEAAVELGLPYVVVPGAVDVINVHLPVPEKFADRVRHMHLPTVPLIRASAEETADVARFIARKVAPATAPVSVLIPRGGFSSLDIAGDEFHDAAADTAFEEALRAEIRDDIPVRTVDAHINDPEFAREVAQATLALLPDRPKEAS